MFQPGDRVRWSTEDNDGLPWSRYGFVGAVDPNGYAYVMFDDELKSSTCLPVTDLVLVSVTAVELRLQGCDLLDDMSLRNGLVSLWSAEADDAGLDIDEIEPLHPVEDGTGEFTLAELSAGGCGYLLCASASVTTDQIWVRAEPQRSSPNPGRLQRVDERRFDGFGGLSPS